MFRKLFGRKTSSPAYDEHAAAALHLLDAAIRGVHPDRFHDELDAAVHIQMPLVMANTMMGRPQEYRFGPLDYEAFVKRFVVYTQKGLLDEAMKISEKNQTMHALMRGIWHEFKLRHLLKQPHDQMNLGKEVQSSTKTLIDFMNRVAKDEPEQ
jgi:hypothetical protein